MVCLITFTGKHNINEQGDLSSSGHYKNIHSDYEYQRLLPSQTESLSKLSCDYYAWQSYGNLKQPLNTTTRSP